MLSWKITHGDDDVIVTMQGVILMYDITSQSTFSDIDRWLRTIRDVSTHVCLCMYGYAYVCAGVWEEHSYKTIDISG